MASYRDHDDRHDVATTTSPEDASQRGPHESDRLMGARQEVDAYPNRNVQGKAFTFRGVAVGLLVGLVICFSNMYFGLQTGWVSSMTMPASLMGFGIFRTLSRHLRFPFTPVENVLVQTVAGAMALMPLGCGFVGVIPAMSYLMKPEEQGPVSLSLGQLLVWSLGLCYFGVVFAVPLRRQVIVREKLRFPSGFSTAVLIGVLHGQTHSPNDPRGAEIAASGKFASLVPDSKPFEGTTPRATTDYSEGIESRNRADPEDPHQMTDGDQSSQKDWAANVRLLLLCFGLSGFYTLCTYFLPFLRNIPIFGTVAAQTWLWTLNPSLAYVGQGIVMGPETTLHMLLGAVVGWGILSPLAKHQGWAPGPVADWENGSKGWIVWVSLSIMLADAVVNLGYLFLQSFVLKRAGPTIRFVKSHTAELWSNAVHYVTGRSRQGYSVVASDDNDEDEARVNLLTTTEIDAARTPGTSRRGSNVGGDNDVDEDAPPEQQVGNKTATVGLILSVLLCVGTVHAVFGELVPIYANVIAVLVALVLSIMGVRALGETDLNPVSGISKLAQLFFALIVPQSSPASVLINLVAGAVSEAGALQAGELMQDLKTGHLLAASPKAQFYGQLIGATCGAIVSALVYQLYTAVYTIPGDVYQIPTAFVWIFTARLVTGKGLPPMATDWALAFGVIFAVLTTVRATSVGSWWRPYVPGGIAVAVGMYNVPSFTLARTIGGLISWWWTSSAGGGQTKSSTTLIIMASGFILGEGFLSIVNLILQSLQVPHLA